MKTHDWSSLAPDAQARLLARPIARSDPAMRERVADIVDDVRLRGWEGVVDIARAIDGVAPERIHVASAAEGARRMLSVQQLRAINMACENVRDFHQATCPRDDIVEPLPGLEVAKIWRAIDRVGLYVPGGSAPLFSTLIMLALPARVAGVGEITVVTPPRPGGGLDPAVAVAADICGIDAIWTIGGAQAIAALAFGAGAIARCDKIFGPGNAWVAEAKRLVSGMAGGPAIDMPAGPSELMVIADASADPCRVAADLLGQAEHDAGAQVILVTDDRDVAARVCALVEVMADDLPRKDTVRSALDHARAIIVDGPRTAIAIANTYAPEHLSLAIADPDAALADIRNAGAVFVGADYAETFADYLAGSSHVLPTDGAARAWSGIGVHSFMKALSVQRASAAAIRKIAGPAATLARMEGLEAHARAAEIRIMPLARQVEA